MNLKFQAMPRWAAALVWWWLPIIVDGGNNEKQMRRMSRSLGHFSRGRVRHLMGNYAMEPPPPVDASHLEPAPLEASPHLPSKNDLAAFSKTHDPILAKAGVPTAPRFRQFQDEAKAKGNGDKSSESEKLQPIKLDMAPRDDLPTFTTISVGSFDADQRKQNKSILGVSNIVADAPAKVEKDISLVTNKTTTRTSESAATESEESMVAAQMYEWVEPNHHNTNIFENVKLSDSSRNSPTDFPGPAWHCFLSRVFAVLPRLASRKSRNCVFSLQNGKSIVFDDISLSRVVFKATISVGSLSLPVRSALGLCRALMVLQQSLVPVHHAWETDGEAGLSRTSCGGVLRARKGIHHRTTKGGLGLAESSAKGPSTRLTFTSQSDESVFQQRAHLFDVLDTMRRVADKALEGEAGDVIKLFDLIDKFNSQKQGNGTSSLAPPLVRFRQIANVDRMIQLLKSDIASTWTKPTGKLEAGSTKKHTTDGFSAATAPSMSDQTLTSPIPLIPGGASSRHDFAPRRPLHHLARRTRSDLGFIPTRAFEPPTATRASVADTGVLLEQRSEVGVHSSDDENIDDEALFLPPDFETDFGLAESAFDPAVSFLELAGASKRRTGKHVDALTKTTDLLLLAQVERVVTMGFDFLALLTAQRVPPVCSVPQIPCDMTVSVSDGFGSVSITDLQSACAVLGALPGFFEISTASEAENKGYEWGWRFPNAFIQHYLRYRPDLRVGKEEKPTPSTCALFDSEPTRSSLFHKLNFSAEVSTRALGAAVHTPANGIPGFVSRFYSGAEFCNAMAAWEGVFQGHFTSAQGSSSSPQHHSQASAAALSRFRLGMSSAAKTLGFLWEATRNINTTGTCAEYLRNKSGSAIYNVVKVSAAVRLAPRDAFTACVVGLAVAG